MPVTNGVGYNRHSTPYKQFALNQAVGHMVGACVSVAARRRQPCIICDMTAGPGHDAAGGEGSPLILARHIQRQLARGHAITLLCVDRNTSALAALRATLAERFPDVPVEFFTDQQSAVQRIPWRAVGLSYWDTTRYNDLDADLLAQFGRSHRAMDILITRECLAGYRMQRAAHCAGTLTIQDYLALTGKKCNYIWQYAKYGWWSFGFADNWEERDPRKLHGLVPVDSPDAREMWRQWTASAADAAENPEGDAAPAAATHPKEMTLW